MASLTPTTAPAGTGVAVPKFVDSAAVRDWLIDEVRLDLVGPGAADTSLQAESLPLPPSRWYLTGYLVPVLAGHGGDTGPSVRDGDADREGDLDSGDDAGGLDDQNTPDKSSARKAWRPSSIGLSFLVESNIKSIEVVAEWGDYTLTEVKDADTGMTDTVWARKHRREPVSVRIDNNGRSDHQVPSSGGMELSVLVRPTTVKGQGGFRTVKAVSLFIVNRRAAINDRAREDESCAFQAGLSISCAEGFCPRQDLAGLDSKDWDARVSDLQFRDLADFAAGHNVSADWAEVDGKCRRIWTTWTPVAHVARVVPSTSDVGLELRMDTLGALADSVAATAALSGVAKAYASWIEDQATNSASLDKRRRETADMLLQEARSASKRIGDGIAALSDVDTLEAFRIANRAIARASRQREAQIRGCPVGDVPEPKWRPFQLAFILLNIRGISDPVHSDRELLDLLFFPTGGGKTEAYLGLAAFTIALRRLKHPDLTGSGLSVLMRYTLRLLTLDQLGRAAGVVCALELERQATAGKLGDWPIEIGLWVGQGSTPNRMGYKGDNDGRGVTARRRVMAFKNNTKKPMPIPLKNCPWCGTQFERDSFDLSPNYDHPEDLKLRCVNRECDFHLGKTALPIVTVDEPIYRRLPAFMIATVDKFASLPWTGEVGGFFGGADRYVADKGFLTAANPAGGLPLPQPLPPPDLVIQDELHLISGPLGTMVGLYETAIDKLCSRKVDGKTVRPKIIASTATVRRAQRQVRALFDRRQVAVFPPPGPDRRDSFFAQTLDEREKGGRRYLGIAAPGGSPKVVFLRTLVTLMAAAETAWKAAPASPKNPADPYMTLVAYFNALRELGGSRRIVEGEVGPRLLNYAQRLRVGETVHFANRQISTEPVELTSRVSTDDVSEAKRRLALPFSDRKSRVDVALATNMISVGLDITRLGLMVVEGQPKTTAEYIQSTSRVGRDPEKPGLVITLLNTSKPRDRSHYERFRGWHAAFYRGVEATSVTPFSPRALDRALAAVAVGLSRMELPQFTPLAAAQNAETQRSALNEIVDAIATRASEHDGNLTALEKNAVRSHVKARVADILDDWTRIATEVSDGGGRLGYQKNAGISTPLLREVLDDDIVDPRRKRFRAPRSLRDVEPPVLVKLVTPGGQSIEE